MQKLNPLKTILKEFILEYPKYCSILLASLILETIIVSGAVLALIPFADFMIDQNLLNPSKITRYVKNIFLSFGINPSFWSFGLLFVFLNLLIGITKTLTIYVTLRFKYLIVKEITSETLESFFKTKWSFFNETSQGKILNTISKELIYIGDTIGQVLLQLAFIFKLIVFLTIPLFLSPAITLMSLIFTFTLVIPFLFLSKKNYQLGKIKTSTANIANGKIVEIIQAAKIIIAHGLQTKAIKSYLKAFENHMFPSIISQTITSIPSGIFPPLGILAVVLAIGINLENGIVFSELTAILWSLLSSIPILSNILQSNLSINNFLPSFEQLKKLKKDAGNNTKLDGQIPFKQLNQCIKFTDVSFSYTKKNKTITKFNAEFKKGSKTALIGASGSGKSTIIDLLIGLHSPDKGTISIDEISISKYKINDFRKKIGFVAQDTILFNDTIRNNLLWTSNESNEKDLWKTLKMANADKFVSELPEKLDAYIGDQGTKLSGGQRQRLAIARALIRKPEVLILDEATSSLDYESERLIQQAIDNLPKSITVIIIAHRLSTIKNANKIYILDKGKIIESGSYDDLNKKNKYLYNVKKKLIDLK